MSHNYLSPQDHITVDKILYLISESSRTTESLYDMSRDARKTVKKIVILDFEEENKFRCYGLTICTHTGCFLRPDIKRFCLTFTIGSDRIWFCLIPVSYFFLQ